jgi:hypothetical protein
MLIIKSGSKYCVIICLLCKWLVFIVYYYDYLLL